MPAELTELKVRDVTTKLHRVGTRVGGCAVSHSLRRRNTAGNDLPRASYAEWSVQDSWRPITGGSSRAA